MSGARPVDGPARWEMAEIIRDAMREADPSTWSHFGDVPDPWKVAFVAVDALDVWVRGSSSAVGVRFDVGGGS